MTGMPIERLSARDYWIIAAVWAIAAVGLYLSVSDNLAEMRFRDPDDALRMVQVRDWIAGQNWFDVTQYRVNPPHGGDMHWLRLIDVPIRALIELFDPLMGRALAEKVAISAGPLMLLALLLVLIARGTMKLGGRALVRTGVLIALTQLFMLVQFVPMRIDHHGWQIVLAMTLFVLALGKPSAGRAAAAGMVSAAYLAVSLEALPYWLLFGAIPAWRYWRGEDAARPLALFLGATAAGSLAILAGTRGFAALTAVHCDSISMPYLASLVVGALLFPLAAIVGSRRPQHRFLVLAITGACALAAFISIAPQCSAGPFAELDPVIRDIWYVNISEGQPLFRQKATFILFSILPSLFGLAGCLLGWLTGERSTRAKWAIAAYLLGGAFLVSLMVTRALYVAHAFAIPGIAILLLHGWTRARAIETTPKRMIASIAVVFLLVPLIVATIASMTIRAVAPERAVRSTQAHACVTSAELDVLRAMPRSTFFAPLDVGPAVLAGTRHSVIATGHHRNNAAMRTVITGFLAPPEEAKTIVHGSAATHLIYCRATNEVQLYIDRADNGLITRLEDSDPPIWLEPLRISKDSGYRIYKIRR